MTSRRGATSGASIHTDPDRARHVIEASRQEFETRHADLKLSPVVALICAYEEEGNIGPVLAAVPKEACGLAVTTLVVVDGGNDRTDEISKESGAVTFVLSENLGHGYALRVGYSLCIELGAQYVVTLDADGQNDPAEIPSMLQPLLDDSADFVIGSRRLGVDQTTDRFRQLGVRVYARILDAIVSQGLTDSSSGYRAFKAELVEDILPHLIQNQYQTAEVLIVASARGWRITERPTVWHPRASGISKKGSNLVFGTQYARVIATTWWRMTFGNRRRH